MRAGFVVVLLVVACKDDSGTAHRVSTGSELPRARTAAPEPPGGPPSCADVGAQLASQVGASKDIEAKVEGGTIAVSGDTLRDGIAEGIADACRTDAWSHDARVCALGWRGSFLRDRAALRDACPGTVR
jgi:hypothetical protein